MTREVLARKLERLRGFLADLRPHAGKSVHQILKARYEVERLLELLVQVAVDMVSHDLAERGIVAESYRDAFLEAGRQALLPEDLAAALADAAGLRNILVHLYEEVDYAIVTASVDRALAEFARFADVYAQRLRSGDEAEGA